jgi:MscS family membrane protein
LGKTIFIKTILEVLRKFAKKTKTTIDDDMLEILEAPLKFSFILLGFYLAKEWLDLSSIEPF